MEMQRLQAEDMEREAQAVRDAAGFARVFELMQSCGRPAVGHNPMMDIAYSIACFGDPFLPVTWTDYKQIVQYWFPSGVYDTKYLARTLPELFPSRTDTALQELYNKLAQGLPYLAYGTS